MKTFRVGDVVVCNSTLRDAERVFGLRGVVVHISGTSVGVNWAKDIDGHNCGQRCPDQYGWYVNNTDLKKLATFKGNK